MKKTISIIGGGPSALILAAMLDENRYDITLFEKNLTVGRKFLVAGDGGFNLTHFEHLNDFIKRYTPSGFMENAIRSFSGDDLRKWLYTIGIETYTGSSNRVFPLKGIKPIQVLKAIIQVLKDKNVVLKTQHQWIGWNDRRHLMFLNKSIQIEIPSDIVVFALGGASWPKTGSDGGWQTLFAAEHIETVAFQASNCAFQIEWPENFISITEGKPLKNIVVNCENEQKKGELVITRFGLEGGAIYALSNVIRNQLDKQGFASITIDLKPGLSIAELISALESKRKKTTTEFLKSHLNLNDVHLNLLRILLTKEEFTSSQLLAEKIKKLPLKITSLGPINEAISTVGGISLSETDAHFQLKKMPGNYVIGEMLDWDAPTGGYLLQACFSMGATLAMHLNSSEVPLHSS